jgi:hypothetical protein
MWTKVWTWCKHSATIVWSRTVAGISIVVGLVNEFVTNDSVHQALQNVMQPKFLPWYLLGVAVITEVARRRTL